MIVPVIINGEKREIHATPSMTVLEVLRREGFFGVKNGCSEGNCGACVILVDGVPQKSCLVFIGQIRDREITTIEGLGTPSNPHPLQDAFVDEAGIQCGFCIPGMILSAAWLLSQNPIPTDEEIKEGLNSHLCRCTGYVKQIKAVRQVANTLQKEISGGAAK
ncbi:MAG: (2Fe-2S)-binding protein [Candidatus Heimdallarchaeota archaeon]